MSEESVMSDMKAGAVIVSALLGLFATAPSRGQAGSPAPAADTSCEATVHLAEDAEKRMGGALYKGRTEGAEAMPGATGAMPGMAGAHEIHAGQQGGVFFTAPNKMNHVEARYSKECGIQVFIYNAFTEPVKVERFQALYRIVPEDDGKWNKEVFRILSPTAAGGILQAGSDHDIKGPYKIELYVKFPESDDAEMFNIPVGRTAH